MTMAMRPMNASIAPAKMTMTWPRERRRAVGRARPAGSGTGSSLVSWAYGPARVRRWGRWWRGPLGGSRVEGHDRAVAIGMIPELAPPPKKRAIEDSGVTML